MTREPRFAGRNPSFPAAFQRSTAGLGVTSYLMGNAHVPADFVDRKTLGQKADNFSVNRREAPREQLQDVMRAH